MRRAAAVTAGVDDPLVVDKPGAALAQELAPATTAGTRLLDPIEAWR